MNYKPGQTIKHTDNIELSCGCVPRQVALAAIQACVRQEQVIDAKVRPACVSILVGVRGQGHELLLTLVGRRHDSRDGVHVVWREGPRDGVGLRHWGRGSVNALFGGAARQLTQGLKY